MLRRLHGRRAMRSLPAATAACVLMSGVAVALEPCAVFAPGADGVLRLDGAQSGSCSAPSRSGRAAAEAFESRPARPKAGPVQPQAAAEPALPKPPRAQPDSVAADPAIEPLPQVAQPAQNAQSPVMPHVEDRAADAGRADIMRLQAETAQLKDEMARLRDEAARLRVETARLSKELAARDQAPAVTGSIAPAPAGSQAPGKTGDSAASSKIVGKADMSKVDTATPAAVAPKGDLLVTEPQSSEAVKAPAGNKNADKPADAQATDPQAFERQKGVVERAWKQLRDLAARMKADAARKSE